MEALFPDSRPLCWLPITKSDDDPNVMPTEVAVYKSMRIVLTKNLNKSVGFVNGMGAEVLDMCDNGLFVKTDQGRKIMVYPWTDENRITAYPFRIGYASTLHKVQGATLGHVTLWLDLPNMPAAGYVALSRVKMDRDWRFIGNPTVHHFTPARFD